MVNQILKEADDAMFALRHDAAGNAETSLPTNVEKVIDLESMQLLFEELSRAYSDVESKATFECMLANFEDMETIEQQVMEKATSCFTYIEIVKTRLVKAKHYE